MMHTSSKRLLVVRLKHGAFRLIHLSPKNKPLVFFGVGLRHPPHAIFLGKRPVGVASTLKNIPYTHT